MALDDLQSMRPQLFSKHDYLDVFEDECLACLFRLNKHQLMIEPTAKFIAMCTGDEEENESEY